MRTLLLLLLAACGSSAPGSGTDDAPSGGDHDAAVDAPPDAATCGKRAADRGLSMRHVQVGGLDRTYLVYLPPNTPPATPVPLVIVFHGYTMSGQSMYDITQYKSIADNEGVALAFPDGQGGPNSLDAPWNVGPNVCPVATGAPPNAAGDDFALIDAIKADIAQDQCLDAPHEFVTGFSMGGYFSHHAGCMRPDVRAVAPHSGGTHDLSTCTNAKRPIIIFHGTGDAVVPDGCDDPSAAIAVAGVEPSAKAWAEHNGCAATTTRVDVTGGHCLLWDSCPTGGQVELCTFDAMSHCWAGGAISSGIYSCPTYESATQLEWRFFKTYAW